MSRQNLLIGDIGGTNARFAIADNDTPGFSQEKTLRCADYDSADSAIKAYLDEVKCPPPTVICLAAAGPVVAERVRFTNNNWSIDAGELRNGFATDTVRLLNDFEAIAYCVPFLAETQFMTVGLPQPRDLARGDFTIAVVGPGTGLGTVGLLRRGGSLQPVVGEGGHVGLAPETKVQMEILAVLRERFDRVSVERLVSGPGLENLYWALTRIHGEKRAPLTAAEIFAHGIDNSDERAAEALQVFFETLGQFAGNIALTFGAFDGVYIAGGISRRYPQQLQSSRFRSGFESKGRYRSLLERVPTVLITYAEPGLLGASFCAQQLAGG